MAASQFDRDSRLVLAALSAGRPITVEAIAAATLLDPFRVIDLLAVLIPKGRVEERKVVVYALADQIVLTPRLSLRS